MIKTKTTTEQTTAAAITSPAVRQPVVKKRAQVAQLKEQLFQKTFGELLVGSTETVHLNEAIKERDLSPYTTQAAFCREFAAWLAATQPDIQQATSRFGTFLALSDVELEVKGAVNNRPSMTAEQRAEMVSNLMQQIVDHCIKSKAFVSIDELFELYNPEGYFSSVATFRRVVVEYCKEYSWRLPIQCHSVTGTGTFLALKSVKVTSEALPTITRTRDQSGKQAVVEQLWRLCSEGATIALVDCFPDFADHYSNQAYFCQTVKRLLEEDDRFTVKAYIGKGTFFTAAGFDLDIESATAKPAAVVTYRRELTTKKGQPVTVDYLGFPFRGAIDKQAFVLLPEVPEIFSELEGVLVVWKQQTAELPEFITISETGEKLLFTPSEG